MRINSKIENVVASVVIANSLDLLKLNVLLPESNYNPGRFPGLVVHMEKPKMAVLMFGSGKVVCTGAKTVTQVAEAIDILCQRLTELNFQIIKHPHIEIQNIVASAQLPQPLNLIAVAQAVGLEKIEYEPEQFPGLVYRMEEPPLVVLLFGSGKLVCTGARSEDHIKKGIQNLYSELTQKKLL